MKSFIDEHRDVHGVEPICKALPIAPSTYYAHAARRDDPELRSKRAKTDEAMLPQVQRIWDENFEVYGVRKVWRQLGREDFAVARCTVQRLMKRLGLKGVIRGKTVRTKVSDPNAVCPLDHVQRQFQADRPNALWVSDFSAPCRRGLQRQREWSTRRSANRSWLIHDRQLQCCLAPVEAGRKGAAKLGRLPTAGCHAQSSLNCTEHGRVAAGRRATARSMVRQRSVRWKPLYLPHLPACVVGPCELVPEKWTPRGLLF